MIFTFHRVLSEPDPLLPNEPSAKFFAERLQWMSELLTVLPLPRAAELLVERRLPPRAACITFDDGYRNNYDIAGPLLKQFGLTATFFVATGAVQSGAMWNDLVIESIRRCGDRLELCGYGLGDHATGSDSERIVAIDHVLGAMKYMPVDERAMVAREIFGMYSRTPLASLMMTPEMLCSLAEAGHDVGAHTISHPILLKVDDQRAAKEIEGSRRWLASVTGRPPISFAYPNGRPGVDFDGRHCDMVRDAGFECAVSTEWGCAKPGSDRMSLPRFTPWETTHDGFIKRLAKTYARSYLPLPSDA